MLNKSFKDELDVISLTEEQKDNPEIAFQLLVEDEFNAEQISNRLQNDPIFGGIYDWYYFLSDDQQNQIDYRDLAELYETINNHKSILAINQDSMVLTKKLND